MSFSKLSDVRRASMSGLCERCSVFVGKLKPGVKMPDLENLFGRYGRIVDMRLQLTRADLEPFAFVTYEKERHAQDAVRKLDGHHYQGGPIRVEKYRRAKPSSSSGAPSPPPRTPYRVSISGLPKSATWTDLKAHFRVIGAVGFTNTFGDSTGVVEFISSRDMDRALKTLDGSTFRSFGGEKSRICLHEIGEPPLRKSRSRSPDRVRGHHHEDSSRSRSRHGRGHRSGSPPPPSGSRSESRRGRGREEEKMQINAKVSKRSSTCNLELERHRRRSHRERSRSHSALRWSRSK